MALWGNNDNVTTAGTVGLNILLRVVTGVVVLGLVANLLIIHSSVSN